MSCQVCTLLRRTVARKMRPLSCLHQWLKARYACCCHPSAVHRCIDLLTRVLQDRTVNWSRWTVSDVRNRLRALPEGTGLASRFESRGKRVDVKLLVASSADQVNDEGLEGTHEPGTCRYIKRDKALLVRSSDGWVKVDRLQIVGKKAGTGVDFANGQRVAKQPCRFL